MSTIIQDLERRQLREVPRFKAGDTVNMRRTYLDIEVNILLLGCCYSRNDKVIFSEADIPFNVAAFD